MKFLLTAWRYSTFLIWTTPLAELIDENFDPIRTERQNGQEDGLICRGHILNVLSNWLYNLYTSTTSAERDLKCIEEQIQSWEMILNIKVIQIQFFGEYAPKCMNYINDCQQIERGQNRTFEIPSNGSNHCKTPKKLGNDIERRFLIISKKFL